jgi:hypothetical protein
VVDHHHTATCSWDVLPAHDVDPEIQRPKQARCDTGNTAVRPIGHRLTLPGAVRVTWDAIRLASAKAAARPLFI